MCIRDRPYKDLTVCMNLKDRLSCTFYDDGYKGCLLYTSYNQAMKGNAYSQSVAESMILFVIVAIVAAVTLKMTKNKQVGD